MKVKKSIKPTLTVKLNDEKVLHDAKKICEDKRMFISDYVTNSVRKENKSQKSL